MRKSILVTGAAGYLGIPLVSELVRRRCTVTAVDSNLFHTLPCLVQFSGIQAILKDYRDLTEKDLENIDIVIHLAAIPNDATGGIFTREICLDINGKSVKTLAQKSASAGCQRFLFMSSCSLYGINETCVEETELNPVSAYSEGKILAEEGLASIMDDQFRIMILRGSTLYGLSSFRTRFDLPVNRFCLEAYIKGSFHSIANALWRPFITVVDAARAIAHIALEGDNTHYNQIYNLGNTAFNWTIGRVAEIIEEEFCVKSQEIPYTKDGRSYHVNCDRLLKAFPEAVPSTTIKEGIKIIHYMLSTGRYSIRDSYNVNFNTQIGYTSLLRSGELNPIGRITDHVFGTH